MSLPKPIPTHNPSHSRSPSKSSLRGASGGTRNPNLLPSPHFEEPLQSERYSADIDNENAIDEEQASSVRDRPFRPLFPLIEDRTTGDHYHPTVHYVFSDDDTDIVTEAALRSLADDEEERALEQSKSQETQDLPERRPAPSSETRQHYIIVDINPTPVHGSTGHPYSIANAQSLSSVWQVTDISITNAPTLHALDSEPDGSEELMLKIEGTGPAEWHDDDSRSDKKKSRQEMGHGNLQEMVNRFEKNLRDIKRLIVAGGTLPEPLPSISEQTFD